MEDRTRDKNNRENIALRYVKGDVVNELLLMVKTTENLDAATFTELTLNTLTENNIDTSCMLNQCYDGARCSTAVYESTFSTLTAINRPQRLSMGHERIAGILFLALEKKRTKSVDLNEVLRIFNNMANRRIQLF
ncbi:unnamed protein product [Parnassius mnemosyne]|uniref:Uncharacterized protein n=1 Tax=Parnassius mnemosyne TaxID=213953 RepID=A0AAV1L326_9NEOP